MHPEQLNQFRQKLQEEKSRLCAQINKLAENGLGNTLAYSTGELSMYDNHPADIGEELFERSKDIALQDNTKTLLDEVENALKKIEENSYGICEKCGDEIPVERLQVFAWATECVDCRRAHESQEDYHGRPIEEEVLAPPFRRTFLDYDYRHSVGYDGEDALQDALKYGSSDTPQDIPGTHDYKDLYPNSDERPGIVEKVDDIPVSLYNKK